MSPEDRSGSEVAELFILAGAAVAPFNFFIGVQISGLYLRPLHLWAFGASLILVAVYRREIARVINGPILAFWGMLAFVVLSTLFATPTRVQVPWISRRCTARAQCRRVYGRELLLQH